jgi:hypothetical protein
VDRGRPTGRASIWAATIAAANIGLQLGMIRLAPLADQEHSPIGRPLRQGATPSLTTICRGAAAPGHRRAARSPPGGSTDARASTGQVNERNVPETKKVPWGHFLAPAIGQVKRVSALAP